MCNTNDANVVLFADVNLIANFIPLTAVMVSLEEALEQIEANTANEVMYFHSPLTNLVVVTIFRLGTSRGREFHGGQDLLQAMRNNTAVTSLG